MTAKERLEGLIDEGGVIELPNPEGGTMMELTLAGALWRRDGRGAYLRWCAIFPEHQGHIHELGYDEARTDNDDRDVLLFKAGKLVAAVVPYFESNLPSDDVREMLARWRAEVKQMDFASFLADA